MNLALSNAFGFGGHNACWQSGSTTNFSEYSSLPYLDERMLLADEKVILPLKLDICAVN